MKKAVKDINDLCGMEIWLQINLFSAFYLRMIQKYLFIVGDLITLESLFLQSFSFRIYTNMSHL